MDYGRRFPQASEEQTEQMKYRIRYSPAAQDDADTIWDDLAAFLGDEDRAEAYVGIQ